MLKLSSMLLLSIGIIILCLMPIQTSAQLNSTQPVSTTTTSPLCPPGYYREDTYGCQWCPSGAYCPGNTYSPIPCPLGTSTNGNGGQSQCTPCMPGTFASVPGTEYCQTCPTGYFCPNTTRGPIACPLGTSTNSASNVVECFPCDQGFVANSTGSQYCMPCPDGFYCPNSTSSIACGVGMASRVSYNDFNHNMGYQSRCVACPVGTYSNSTGTGMCQPCPNGYFCPDPSMNPVRCPKGTSSSVTYYNNNYFYIDGVYFYVYTDYNNQKIWVNSKQYAFGERCFECPVGYYADETGLTTCKQCPPGYMCPDKKAAPTPCPIGFYSNTWDWYYMNSMSQLGDTCKRCSPGSYANTTASTYCMACPYDKYCPDPAIAKPMSPPTGFTVSSSSSWNGNEMIYQFSVNRCGYGNFVPPGENYCQYCQPGSYCPDPSVQPLQCPEGYTVSGMGGPTGCTPCMSSTYGNGASCDTCPPGFSCNMPNEDPKPCPRGSYSYGGVNSCSKCPAGSYNTAAGSTGCLECPAGCCCDDPAQDPVC